MARGCGAWTRSLSPSIRRSDASLARTNQMRGQVRQCAAAAGFRTAELVPAVQHSDRKFGGLAGRGDCLGVRNDAAISWRAGQPCPAG